MKYIKIGRSSLPLRMVEFPGMGREKSCGEREELYDYKRTGQWSIWKSCADRVQAP